jgi:hypothetical protein
VANGNGANPNTPVNIGNDGGPTSDPAANLGSQTATAKLGQSQSMNATVQAPAAAAPAAAQPKGGDTTNVSANQDRGVAPTDKQHHKPNMQDNLAKTASDITPQVQERLDAEKARAKAREDRTLMLGKDN